MMKIGLGLLVAAKSTQADSPGSVCVGVEGLPLDNLGPVCDGRLEVTESSQALSPFVVVGNHVRPVVERTREVGEGLVMAAQVYVRLSAVLQRLVIVRGLHERCGEVLDGLLHATEPHAAQAPVGKRLVILREGTRSQGETGVGILEVTVEELGRRRRHHPPEISWRLWHGRLLSLDRP